MQDGQNCAIARRIQKFVAVPTAGKRPRLCLAVSDHAADEQVRIVKRGAIRVRDRIPEFATFMNRAGSLRRNVARNSAGKRELLEQFSHAVFGLRDVRIELAVRSFQIGVCDKCWTAVSRDRRRKSHSDRVS